MRECKVCHALTELDSLDCDGNCPSCETFELEHELDMVELEICEREAQ